MHGHLIAQHTCTENETEQVNATLALMNEFLWDTTVSIRIPDLATLCLKYVAE